MENIINVTEHGRLRLIERVKCKRSKIEKLLNKVWASGYDECHYANHKSLYKYLVNVRYNSGANRSIRVKGNMVYIFNLTGTVFVTCYDIPQKVIQDIKAKKKMVGKW